MFVARSIAADHKDLIHDVSYDFHGRRMATCSSDQSVKVWDKSENLKTHSGSVWRVTWAHPEFGQVLASCSFDRTAAVWEEIVGESNDKQRGQSHWIKRTTLVDSRTSVTDVKFAPKHMGLMLTTCSADGVVRVYEAPDVMNLSQWSLQHEISCKLSCSCISWNPSSSRAHPPMIAVGSDDSNVMYGGKVQIYEYNENTRSVLLPGYYISSTMKTLGQSYYIISIMKTLGQSYYIIIIMKTLGQSYYIIIIMKTLGQSYYIISIMKTLGQSYYIISIMKTLGQSYYIISIMKTLGQSYYIISIMKTLGRPITLVNENTSPPHIYTVSLVPIFWSPANYMDNWKCTGILKGDGSPVNGSSGQPGAMNTMVGSTVQTSQNALNGSAAGR
uniref:nucleoporin SEH1-like n=1 Tax=Oncorhynchus gorbuscha TaxID=8017 RepID=UPI001EAE856B|nr:nucleoporin SEH1-like [Oncorhynchus gorbuscha]